MFLERTADFILFLEKGRINKSIHFYSAQYVSQHSFSSVSVFIENDKLWEIVLSQTAVTDLFLIILEARLVERGPRCCHGTWTVIQFLSFRYHNLFSTLVRNFTSNGQWGQPFIHWKKMCLFPLFYFKASARFRLQILVPLIALGSWLM